MSLKNLLFSAIKDAYPNMLTIAQFNEICDTNKYKRSNGERRMRPSESPGIREIKNSKKFIIGYIYINPALKDPRDSEPSSMSLDDQLKNILFVTKPTWENAEKIKEINKVLKSGHEYYKKTIIFKYK